MKKYTIPKDNHSSGLRFPKLTFKNTIEFSAVFLNSCLYPFINKDSEDINKLYGISDSWSFHHKHSARIGWLPKEGKIQLYLYVYYDGLRLTRPITLVELNSFNEFKITMEQDRYLFSINGEFFSVKRHDSRKGGLKYHLYPYFGGDNKAPHNINILLDNR